MLLDRELLIMSVDGYFYFYLYYFHKTLGSDQLISGRGVGIFWKKIFSRPNLAEKIISLHHGKNKEGLHIIYSKKIISMQSLLEKIISRLFLPKKNNLGDR